MSDKYFLVSCKPTPDSLWGIYLVDVFDNLVLLKEQEGHALLEPIPLRPTRRPRIIPDRTVPDGREGTVYVADIYSGPGLQGIPRGTVKSLRVFTYHFAFQKQAGIQHRVGADGPWEVKQVLGTAPVEADGSAYFRVPAKTPISLQPLDEEGKAIQLMRSWLTVMPGEIRSCVGCHEDNAGVPTQDFGQSIAGLNPPREITPWYGPTRGFSFTREVQPVLDKYCVGCHDGSPTEDGQVRPDLRATSNVVWGYKHGNPDLVRYEDTPLDELAKKHSGLFPQSYVELRKQVRVGGLESDLHLLPPMEFHADTSRLVQMLKKGHHGVQLGPEAWDRLVTWIDLNAPCHGTWNEFTPIRGDQAERRCELQAMYGGRNENGEAIVYGEPPFGGDLTPVAPQSGPSTPQSEQPVESMARPAGESVAAKRDNSPAEADTEKYLELGFGHRCHDAVGSHCSGHGHKIRIQRSPVLDELLRGNQSAVCSAGPHARQPFRTSWILDLQRGVPRMALECAGSTSGTRIVERGDRLLP